MEKNSVAHAIYWRNSLADAGSSSGTPGTEKKNQFHKIQREELATGRVSNALVAESFKGKAKGIETVEVIIRPKVYILTTEHGQQRQLGIPQTVTPIVARARLSRNGRLYPEGHPVVPRDILEPLERGSFSIGTVFDQDAFLTTSALPEIAYSEARNFEDREFGQRWSNYLTACELHLQAVAPDWPEADQAFILADFGYLMDEESNDGTRRRILPLYDHICKHNPVAPLFDRYASIGSSAIEPCLVTDKSFSARLGHPSDAFPLAQAQRDSLAHQLAVKGGEILAVNGPPGTGKTTLLLSVVASLWAKAALEGGEPPVILAASTNNQAVTNIIDAFGKNFSEGTGVLAGRWLPNVKSFGGYLPNSRKEDELADTYQTRHFFEKIESAEYVTRAEKTYLQAARRAFPAGTEEVLTVQKVLTRLSQSLKQEADKLRGIETAWLALTHAREQVRAELGDDPSGTIVEWQKQLASTEAEVLAFTNMANQLETYLAGEPIFYSLFSWLPAVRKKRVRLALLSLKDSWPPQIALDEWQTPEQIEQWIKTKLDGISPGMRAQRVRLQHGSTLLNVKQERSSEWRSALIPLGVSEKAEHLSLAECDTLADTSLRFTIFQVTTHYWEGRWLADMQALLPNLEQEKRKSGRVTIERRWKRRMKMTPCIVSTLFMLPAEMKVSKRSGQDYADDYLYNFADLLIIDEASQILPHVAGASFALAKKALVIGDTLQIEPIRSTPRRVDMGNLRSAGLVSDSHSEEAYECFFQSGKSAASGNVMRIAQKSTRYHYDLDMARGMFLYEHRRCFDEIIEYCNKLCYHGKLIPKRGSKAKADQVKLPALGYLHIDGICEQNRASRQNLLEAQTIAAWIGEHQEALKARYDRPLSNTVAVITPFSSQVGTISVECQKLGIRTGSKDDEMTVGTVHSLQGAERPIVIFSSVYSKHADGGFIDINPSILNVAVSRAQDSFLVFGDMDVFDVLSEATPRGLLASFLFRDEANALQFEYRPRPDLQGKQVQIHQLRDTYEHDVFLLNSLASVTREIHIVTPWIRLSRIKDIGALEAMVNAVKRGVRVNVYTDPELNAGQGDGVNASAKYQTVTLAASELKAKGINTVFVRKVHSKAIIGDDNLYCVGSFNWFSASRDPRYAKHETSLVYQGIGLAKEITTLRESLEQRVISRLQPEYHAVAKANSSGK